MYFATAMKSSRLRSSYFYITHQRGCEYKQYSSKEPLQDNVNKQSSVKKNVHTVARKMTQSTKCLQVQGTEFDPQNPWYRLVIPVQGRRDRRIPGAQWPASLL